MFLSIFNFSAPACAEARFLFSENSSFENIQGDLEISKVKRAAKIILIIAKRLIFIYN